MRRATTTILGAVLLLSVLLSAGLARAQQPISIDATLSDSSVLMGDIVTVQLRAVARVDGQVEVSVPAIDGLTEINRSRSEGTSISWTNAGQSITREVTINVEYSADRPGKIQIPSFVAQAGRHAARTKPMVIEVVGAADVVAPATGAGEVAPPSSAERRLFVRYRLNKTEAFLGEQVLMDLEIFSAPGQGFSVEDIGAPPELDGFWKEIVDRPQRLTRRSATVAGQRYDVYRVWRVAMFPLAAGEKTVPPNAVTFSTGRSLFGSGRRIRRRPLPVKIEVKPLPTEGRPADFSNANVGQFALKASVDHDKVPAGKAVLLSMELSGRGNLTNVRLPEVKEIDGFRVFPPTVKEHPELTPSGVKGRKTAEILLMPVRGGRLEIPSFTMTIFDPDVGEYRLLSTQSLRIAVSGDPSEVVAKSMSPETPGKPPPEKIARSDLRPLRFRSRLLTGRTAIWKRPAFVALLAGPPLLFILAIALELLIARARRETPASKRRAAAALAKKRLETAQQAANAGDVAGAYAELVEAVTELGSIKCGVALRGLTTEQIASELKARAAPSDLILGVTEELEAADYARFAAGRAGDPGAMVDRWTDLLERLDAWQPKEVTS